jgi:uncharacterized protein
VSGSEDSQAHVADVGDELVCRYVLLKLAARCNINCSYCYWFRDDSVYQKPPRLTEEAETAFLEKLDAHAARYRISSFSILFHGGEPLLFGKRRFERLVDGLRDVERRRGFALHLAITTNGVLIDAEWAELLRAGRVAVTVSIDGPRATHDRNRVDFRGRGTFERAIAGLEILRAAGVDPAVLAVCNPADDPEDVAAFFVDELGVTAFDILVPDATHEDRPASIARFYEGLFDLWYDRYGERDIDIRFPRSIAKGLLGIPSGSESIGYGPVTTLTMLTDGALEPLDVLRTARFAITTTDLNIRTHSLQDIQRDPLWREIRDASIHLAPVCEACEYRLACGGGHIASRWSRERRYDNPSVYCSDFKAIFSHAWQRMLPDLYLDKGDEKVSLESALRELNGAATG